MQGYFQLYKKIKTEFALSPKSTARWDVGNAFMGRYVFRPLGLLAAPLFVKLSFSANGVTLLSFLVGTIANLLFLAGDSGWFLVAALCYFLFAVLDFTDGLIARHERKSTHFGKMLDLMSGTLVASFVPLCVGFGVIRAGVLPDWLNAPLAFAFIAALATTANLLNKTLSASFSLQVAQVRGDPGQTAQQNVPGGGLSLLFRRAMFHLTATTSQLVLLVLAVFGLLYLFPPIFLAIAGLQLALTLLKIFKTGPRLLAIEKL